MPNVPLASGRGEGSGKEMACLKLPIEFMEKGRFDPEDLVIEALMKKETFSRKRLMKKRSSQG